MNEDSKLFIKRQVASPKEAFAVIERLFEVTQPGAVYAPPVTVGEHTVITASELITSVGAGYGGGSERNEEGEEKPRGGFGGGGGGGGVATGRPVAAISIGPGGVRVEPIVDPTKIAIAFFTTLAAMAVTLSQVSRFRRSRSTD